MSTPWHFLLLPTWAWPAAAVGLGGPLLARAMAAGRCRADLLTGDLLLIAGMFGAARRGCTAAERLQLSERAWCLIREGLEP